MCEANPPQKRFGIPVSVVAILIVLAASAQLSSGAPTANRNAPRQVQNLPRLVTAAPAHSATAIGRNLQPDSNSPSADSNSPPVNVSTTQPDANATDPNVSAPPLDGNTPQFYGPSWSGYVVATNLNSPADNSVTFVSGQWIVPALDDSSGMGYSSFWVGMDGFSNGTVEQIGMEADYFLGQPYYYGWFQLYPLGGQNFTMDILPGDVMEAQVRYDANDQFLLSLSNLTTGEMHSFTVSYPQASRATAEWVAEAPYYQGILPLADFGTVQFMNLKATIKNQTQTNIASGALQDAAIIMADDANTIKAVPSGYSPTDSSFTITWLSSVSPWQNVGLGTQGQGNQPLMVPNQRQSGGTGF